jgi:ComF family protein
MGTRIHEWVRTVRPLADAFFPRLCQVCDHVVLDPVFESICESCWKDLKPPANRCQRCCAPTERGVEKEPPECRLCKKEWKFRKAFCLCTYHGVASKAARKMKSSQQEPLARAIGNKLGTWLNETVDLSEYACLVPIPQHWVRRALMRYNQAEVLAYALNQVCGLPVRLDLLYRIKWTEKQGTKTIEERLLAVRDSFACRPIPDLKGKQILLVDDIVTSGSTASEAARAMRTAGARRVDVVAFARGASTKHS